METHPFFALLLMYLKFVAVPEMKQISTNGHCIYFSPNYIDKLYDYELDYILCHQIMHIIFGHIWLPIDRTGYDCHFACDIQINANLTKCGFVEERYPHLGYIYRNIPGEKVDVYEMTAGEIFERLPYSLYIFDERTRNKFFIDDDTYWSKKEDIGSLGEIILDLPKEDGMSRKKDKKKEKVSEGSGYLKQEWQGRAVSTVKAMKMLTKDASNVPDFMKRIIEKTEKPTVDWRKVLNNFVQEQICDYSFSPPDIRFSDTGFFLPDFNEKEFITKDILFMVDTSGSVGDKELAAVYSEIKGAIEQFGGRLMGKLGFFDADVTPPLPFESVGELMKIIPYGGGGTDFRVIFDYIRMNYIDELPACIVIFTDGYGSYPAESETMGIPVLWIINSEFTPPWGKIIHITSSIE